MHRATHKESGFVVAVKIIPKMQSENQQEELKKEIGILKKCSHDCIVQYYGCCFTDDSLWVSSLIRFLPARRPLIQSHPIQILMDYCGIGSVMDILKARKPRALEENEVPK